MRSVLDDLLYIYNHHNGIGGDTKIIYQPFDVDIFGHLHLRWEPRLHRMQVHLWLKTKVSDNKGRHGPMVNAMCCYLPNSRWEVESPLMKA